MACMRVGSIWEEYMGRNMGDRFSPAVDFSFVEEERSDPWLDPSSVNCFRVLVSVVSVSVSVSVE